MWIIQCQRHPLGELQQRIIELCRVFCVVSYTMLALSWPLCLTIISHTTLIAAGGHHINISSFLVSLTDIGMKIIFSQFAVRKIPGLETISKEEHKN